MPPWKKPPSSAEFKPRDFWGDETEGEKFKRQLGETFGTGRGSKKCAMNVLGIERRIMNMYFTGQRKIPDDVQERLSNHIAAASFDWGDDINPLD